ncbi:multidrug ABC transporter permease [Neobacillus piezotolerans]|uniref:Multidrug ABC transporter permease n=1 Tax=Neobacillus piezotolerans TaxID=2259171 RepID=A0A3D8GWN2_9BACI|nr:multidrug ABC transporter permease [Neobacillus piezotolerans]RDU38854.1 multidrug ABC transporter permease [Neobacillus piezotolerans]
MPSRMSLFNKDLILQIGRSVGWISIVYFLVLLFILPIRMMMLYADREMHVWTPRETLFLYEFGIQFILMVTAPVLLSVFLYRFLHVRQWSDLMHSLPVKRAHIYNFYTVAGLVFLALPIMLIAAIILVLHTMYGWNLYMSVEDIAAWAGLTLVFNFVFYLAGVFVAMVTGISAVQAVLTYIFLLFPAGISLLVIYNLGELLYGFPSSYYRIRNIEYLSPLTHLTVFENPTVHIGWKHVLIYLAVSAVLYVLGLFIYQKRKSEAASEAIAFDSLKVVFKFGVTVCTMMVGGMYFGNYQHTFGWMAFGYAFGAIIGYFVAEMVLQKTWRVFNNLRGFAIYAGVIALMILGLQAFGSYEKRIPAKNEIKSVMVSNFVVSYQDETDQLYRPVPLKGEESIEMARKLHSVIIERNRTNRKDPRITQPFFFTYELKNGGKLVREYNINPDEYDSWLRPLQLTSEYKHSINPIFKIKESSLRQIVITDGVGLNKKVMISDSREAQEALSILKKEVENESYKEWKDPVGTRSYIEIQSYQGVVQIEFKKSYTEFAAWLDEKGLFEEASISPDDVDYIAVVENSREVMSQFAGDLFDDPMKQVLNKLIIKEKMDIREALDQSGRGWDENDSYVAVVVYKHHGVKEMRSIDEKNVPDFIKKHFDK